MSRTVYFVAGLNLPYFYNDPIRELSHLSSAVTVEDKTLIKGLCPSKGILQQMVQCYISSICTNLRKNDITHYSPANSRYLIELINRGCAAIELDRPTVDLDVPRRATKSCSKPAGSDIKHYDPAFPVVIGKEEGQTNVNGDESKDEN